MTQAITPASGVVHLSKACSRADKVLVSFTDASADILTRDFRAMTMNAAGTSSLYLTIGAKRVPEVPLSGLDQVWTMLKMTLGPAHGPVDIDKSEFTTNAALKKMVAGFPLNKLDDGSLFQGENMRGSQLCSVHFTDIGAEIDRCHVLIYYSAIVSCSAEGCVILD